MSGSGGHRGFIGRADQLAVLGAAWAQARSGRPSTVVVSGPAGFGKTSLIARFLREAGPVNVVRAIGEPDEDTLPFGVLSQLLRSYDARLAPAASATMLPSDLAVSAANPLAAGAALLDLIEAMSPTGLILVIDDLQWADVDSIRALVFALRRVRSEPVMTVLGCRANELGRLPQSLQRLVADEALRIDLEGFDPDELAGLAQACNRGGLSRAAIDRVRVLSAGSPLHATALFDELTQAQLEGDPGRPLPAPRTFRGLIAARLDACPPPGRAMVEAVAVAGEGLSLAQLARIGDLGDPHLALDQAPDLIALQVPGGTVHLVHPLIGSAVYHSITASRQAELHRRAGRELAEADVPASLRHRAACTVGPDDALARLIGEQARAHAEAGSWHSAAHDFRAAVELSMPGGPGAAALTLQMVDCLALSGEVAATRAAAVRLESTAPSVLRSYCLGRLRALSGELEYAGELLRQAWTQVEDQPGADQELTARIAGELGRLAVMTGHGAEGVAWAQRSLALSSPTSAARGDTMAMILLGLGIQGRASEGLALVGELPARIDDPGPAELDGLVGRGLLSLWSADLDQARSDLTTVVRATRRDGPVHVSLFASSFLADTTYRLGLWDATAVEASASAALARDLDSAWTAPMLHALASMPRSARGQFDEAAAQVRAAAEAAEICGDVPSRMWAAVAAGRLARARRDPAGVIAALAPLAAMTDLDGVREPGVQMWQPLYGGALARSGRYDEASAVFDEAEYYATSRNHPVQQLAVERGRAELAVMCSDLRGAERIIRGAEHRYQACAGRPFERAQFDLTCGQVLRRIGDRQAAKAALIRADAGFVRLGAAPWIADTEAELALVGMPRRSRAVLPGELTAHEGVVADLVGQGLSNREVATRLGVSIKGVEYHLTNIYAKLGVNTRVQLAVRRTSESDSAQRR